MKKKLKFRGGRHLMKKIKSGLLSALVLFGAMGITASESTEEVSAATTLDIERAISEVVGGDNQNNWHYSYAGGDYFDAILSKSTTKEKFHEIGLDCSSGTIAVVARAIANAGGDPSEYFSDLAGYLNKTNNFDGLMSHAKVIKVASTAAEYTGKTVGDIVVYGKAHMNVYVGNNQTFDFGSNGAHTETQKGRAAHTTWTDVATSTTGGEYVSGVYRVILDKDIDISIIKKTTNENLVKGNNKYTLAGAVYGIYSDQDATNKLGEITTNAEGKGLTTVTVSMNTSKVYIKELVAPQGYYKDEEVHEHVIGSDNKVIANYDEEPQNDPVTIKVEKKNGDGALHPVSLAGAIYTVDFYTGTDYQDGEAASKHWAYKTIDLDNGTYGWKYNLLSSKTNSVEGYTDDLYYDIDDSGNSIPVLPYGTLVISEYQAPEGYQIDGSYTTINGEKVSDNTSIVLTVDEINKGSELRITTLQDGKDETKALETPEYGYFNITKLKADNSSSFDKLEAGVQFTAILSKEIQGRDDAVDGAVFKNYKEAYDTIISQLKAANQLNDDGSVKEKIDIVNENGTILLTKNEYDVIVTGKDGKASSNKLAYGSYVIRQTSHSAETVDIDWNDIHGEQVFTVDHNWAQKDAVEFYATNTPTPYYLRLVKKDKDTGKTVSLNGTTFKIEMLKDADGNDVAGLTKDFEIPGTSNKMHIVGTKDKDGTNHSYVTMKVGSSKYDTFTTNNKDNDKVGYVSVDDELGTVVTPLQVVGGTYKITEVNTPDGYLELENPITFTVTESSISELVKDSDGDLIKEIVIENEQPTGELVIEKDVVKYENADQTLIDYSKLYENIQFTLYAAENIVDPADGKVLATKDDVAVDIKGNVVGQFNLNSDGTYDLKDLPMGKYYLKETSVPPGIVLDETVHNVEFTQEDQSVEHKTYKFVFSDDAKTSGWADGVKIVGTDSTILNKVTKAEISKTDITGEKELEGATLTITDSKGNVVKDASGEELTWVSGKKTHTIEGLHIGEKYTLTETISAPGYVKATSMPFEVNKDGSVTPVHMIDKIVSVSKIDMDGKEVKDAQMSVTDTDGNVIDSWTSDGTEHRVNGLEEGKTYVLHEVVAPNGYAKATDIEFTVTGADEKGVKVDQHIDMTDKKVIITKTDVTGEKEVEGATLTIKDSEGNVVETWTSSDKPHETSGLEVGKTYTLTEESAPDGYYYSRDIEFTVTDDGVDQVVNMVDEEISYLIKKVDNNGDAVVGVTLKLTDVTDSENPVEVELPNGGVTTEEPFDMTGKLIAGHKYVLEETQIINGVFKAANIEFTVEKYATGETTTITMVDDLTQIAIKKVNPSGEALAGAKMQIIEAVLDESDEAKAAEAVADKNETGVDDEFGIDDEGVMVLGLDDEATAGDDAVATKPEETDSVDEDYTLDTSEMSWVPAVDEDGKEKVVYEFTSTDDVAGTDISKYVQGDKTYILREVEAPFGFEKFEDQVFTVTGKENSYQLIQAVDARETYYVSAVKVDAKDNTKTLAGATLALFTSANKIALDVNGKACTGTTDSKGNITWNVAYNDDLGGYYVKELKAPTGYKLSNTKYAVKLASDYDFADNNPIKIVVTNEHTPTWGAGTFGVLAGVTALGATGGLVAVKKKKKEDEVESNDSAE